MTVKSYKNKFNYTLEELELHFKTLWRRGFSNQVLAEKFGMSRGTVHGLTYRMGLSKNREATDAMIAAKAKQRNDKQKENDKNKAREYKKDGSTGTNNSLRDMYFEPYAVRKIRLAKERERMQSPS